MSYDIVASFEIRIERSREGATKLYHQYRDMHLHRRKRKSDIEVFCDREDPVEWSGQTMALWFYRQLTRECQSFYRTLHPAPSDEKRAEIVHLLAPHYPYKLGRSFGWWFKRKVPSESGLLPATLHELCELGLQHLPALKKQGLHQIFAPALVNPCPEDWLSPVLMTKNRNHFSLMDYSGVTIGPKHLVLAFEK